jgi:hypothetical protein
MRYLQIFALVIHWRLSREFLSSIIQHHSFNQCSFHHKSNQIKSNQMKRKRYAIYSMTAMPAMVYILFWHLEQNEVTPYQEIIYIVTLILRVEAGSLAARQN